MFTIAWLPNPLAFGNDAATVRQQGVQESATRTKLDSEAETNRNVDGVAHQNAAEMRRSAGFEPVSPDSLTSIRLECETREPATLERLSCNGPVGRGLVASIEDAVKRQLAVENRNTYHGIRTDYTGGLSAVSGTPVCNISKGEETRNYRNQTCGDYCNMEIDIGLLGADIRFNDRNDGCSWEYSQIRGAWVQILNYYKDVKLAEVRGRTVSLIDIEGERPCKQVAADYVTAQNALQRFYRTAESNLTNQGFTAQQIATMQCNRASQDSDHALCHIQQANRHLVSLAAKVVGCEIRWAATKTYNQYFSDPTQVISAAQQEIQPRCAGCEDCIDDSGRADESCNNSKRSQCARRCYISQIHQFFKNRLRSYANTSAVERNE